MGRRVRASQANLLAAEVLCWQQRWLLRLTDSVISRPSEATNSAAIPASSIPGSGTSTRKPWTARPPPLANVTVASKDARYSVMGKPEPGVHTQLARVVDDPELHVILA